MLDRPVGPVEPCEDACEPFPALGKPGGDLVEGTGGVHFKADPRRTDEQNYRDGYNRVYDTLELERNLDDVFGILPVGVVPIVAVHGRSGAGRRGPTWRCGR